MNAGGTAFDRTFQNFWTGESKVHTLAVLQGEAGEKLALIGADFTLARNGDSQGFAGHFGQGNVYPEVLAELVAETRSIKSKHGKAAVIWCIHYPPFFPNIASPLKLINEQTLVTAADQEQVRQILSGHTHAPAQYPVGSNGLSVYCAGTTTQYYAPKPNTMHLRNLSVDNGAVTSVNSTTLAWSQAAKDFK